MTDNEKTRLQEVEIIENCTVQILRDKETGKESIAWYRGTESDLKPVKAEEPVENCGLSEEEYDRWCETVSVLTVKMAEMVIKAADEQDIDRNSALQYVGKVFSELAEVSDFTDYKIKQTNFDKATASPKALAEFVTSIRYACAREDDCELCPLFTAKCHSLKSVEEFFESEVPEGD